RNLYDDQINAMFENGSLINVVFNPPFIQKIIEKATVDDLFCHIDKMCTLGGEKQNGLGYDFDGIDTFIKDLENGGKYNQLVNRLLKYYSEEQVRGFCSENFLKHLPKQ